ncbi:E3 ubiquitin-protein ligase RNF38 isoform X2 [Lingula anatina]|uniref:E3 ubiquitin-protein ligase RNF38 isoform X2 n=1 Tax=Lingula anatina TaxID=7574 RepID=A0A1S3HDS8_LINAN|nr:E3 ubiquitin-protein ligase RNF38 isoform X2 [Lingula anatina]|eukprot:XP_013383249.1 E3 ubiquitin-protein ligase RNF38 isoform X2 [Lingula anatina]
MPVASQNESQMTKLHQIVPKPSSCHDAQLASDLVHSLEGHCVQERHTFGADVVPISPVSSQHSGPDSPAHFFNTQSPPIINLSPNLSPAEPQRTSPVYDLRETTRRRSSSVQDFHSNLNHQMQHSPQFISSIISEDTDSKSESPARKRRKTSAGVIDLTSSPSPPSVRPWESVSDSTTQRPRRKSTMQRRVSVERCNTPRGRRSPGASRRRTRERNTPQEPSPERRAFQPPNPILRPSHSTVLPHHHQQQTVMVDVDQAGRHVGWRDNAPVSNPVTVAPYAIPVCTGPHHLPVCTTTHIPVCTTAQPTWSLPACTVFPTCSIQHIPACSLQQIPVTHGAITPMLHAAHPPQYHMTHHPHPQPHHHPHHPHHNPHPHLQAPQHMPAATQFLPTTPSPPTINRLPFQTHHHAEDDIQIIGERRPMYHHPHIPSAMHASHPVPPLNPSPPVILQEPTVHPTPQEFYGPFSRYQNRRTTHRNRWRSIPPPPPPYPGFLLHFLAMLGNPPYPPHMVDINDDTAEVENYEALLNLAERLGEAKPRGLTKADIDQLPSYRFNVDTRTDEDQTSCVVCMCDFEQKQQLRVLPCSHEFHIKCVDKWLKSNRTCPICRADSSGSAHAE